MCEIDESSQALQSTLFLACFLLVLKAAKLASGVTRNPIYVTPEINLSAGYNIILRLSCASTANCFLTSEFAEARIRIFTYACMFAK